ADLLGQRGMPPTGEEHETLAFLSDDAGHRWLRPPGVGYRFRVPVFPVAARRNTAGSPTRAVSVGRLPCVPAGPRRPRGGRSRRSLLTGLLAAEGGLGRLGRAAPGPAPLHPSVQVALLAAG